MTVRTKETSTTTEDLPFELDVFGEMSSDLYYYASLAHMDFREGVAAGGFFRPCSVGPLAQLVETVCDGSQWQESLDLSGRWDFVDCSMPPACLRSEDLVPPPSAPVDNGP